MNIHVIIKNRATFEVSDHLYASSVSIASNTLTVTYYDDAEHTGSAHTATYSSLTHLCYVVPVE